MFRWLKRTAARALLRASGELVRWGLKLTDEQPPLPDELEEEDDGLPAPPQNPLTDASHEMMVKRKPIERKPPESDPPLAGSARERYVKARKRLN